MKIEQGKKVKMEYELGIVGGGTIESSASRGPLEFVHGTGKMLPGLEKQLEGLEVGAEKEGVIPAAEAFGTEESLPTIEIPRTNFPANEDVKPGKPFEAKDASGNPIRFKVTKVDGDKVTVRLDHPLAGKDIRFKVKILEVSAPS
jgi:FKBP-type peptidyl-prolyl cis-trans isomerase 2